MKLPRFTLRDLFWLVLVCALAVAWWVERRSLQDQLDALRLPTVEPHTYARDDVRARPIELQDFRERP